VRQAGPSLEVFHGHVRLGFWLITGRKLVSSTWKLGRKGCYPTQESESRALRATT